MLRNPKLAWLFIGLLLAGIPAAGCLSSAPAPVRTSQPTRLQTPSAIQTPAATPGPAPISSSPAVSPPREEDDWPTYHRDLSRSGYDPGVSPGNSLHRLWTSDRLDGEVYAEPLIVSGMVLAATEQDSVYAFDVDTGKPLWKTNLGTPVPLAELSCGNINPSGITGTPAADPATRRLYVAARIQPDHHELFVIDINTGAVLSHRPVDPPGADPRVQQQRAALALSGGKVYIAFGGLAGDCGSYYGWLVGAPAAGDGQLLVYRVSSHTGAGLWAPSGPAVDEVGNIYITSGNAFSGSTFDFGNAVIRLSPELARTDWFAPENWQELDAGDIDLGSMGPSLVQGGMVFQAGKEGKGYLLRADNLGHIGGELFSGSIGQGAYGGTAYMPPYIFVPTNDGLAALTIDSGPSFKVAWSSPSLVAGPPVVAGDTVITVDTAGGNLYGFKADTGTMLFKISLGHVVHFTTPALSGGKVFVAADRQIIGLGP